MTDDEKRRIYQKLKYMTNERFWAEMNRIHTAAYAKAVQHYTEAAEIVLTPKLQKQLHDKATEIREVWDGMSTVTVEDTKDAVFKGVKQDDGRSKQVTPHDQGPASEHRSVK